MVRSVREAQNAAPEETLRLMCRDRGKALVDKILGDGVKRLAPSEEANYERTRRSIHALRDISPGEIITKDMIACLRTEKILRPGLAPSWEKTITGLKAINLIPAGEGIRLEDIMPGK